MMEVIVSLKAEAAFTFLNLMGVCLVLGFDVFGVHENLRKGVYGNVINVPA